MRIDGRTAIFGIFGSPVSHTFSPILHNAVFERHQRNAVYVPFEVHPDVLYAAVDALRSISIGGVNVTLPHKEKILHLLDEIPRDLDRAIGAINTVAVKKGLLYGYNTDGPGFLWDLKDQFAFDPRGKTVLMAGAGGTARALAFTLMNEGCSTLYVSNRTLERARGLEGYLKGFFPQASVEVIAETDELEGEELDLVVNATACGMKETDPYPLDPRFLEKTRLVYDVIYSPRETRLVLEARARGLRASNGIGMLIHQASLAHAIWFPEVDGQEVTRVMRDAYEKWEG